MTICCRVKTAGVLRLVFFVYGMATSQAEGSTSFGHHPVMNRNQYEAQAVQQIPAF